MSNAQIAILVILVATMAMFLRGGWRHDMVAVASLLACVLVGVVVPGDAFSGFAHPAVITVACVLVLSRGLQVSGAVDIIARHALPKKAGPALSIAALVGLGAVLSGFMNNVGAMALLMPVAVQIAKRLDLAPGQVLMPLAFGTILGGMTTLIGTPPNLIVSGFRAEMSDGDPDSAGGFGMFDFTPVGLAVAACGVAFVAVVGWHLVPAKRSSDGDEFETGAYLTEARVQEGGKAVGMTLREVEGELEAADAQVVGLVRNEVRVMAPRGARRIRANDILALEADVDTLPEILSSLGLRLEEQGPSKEPDEEPSRKKKDTKRAGFDVERAETAEEEEGGEREGGSNDISLMELVVRPESPLIRNSAKELMLRTRYGINLIAVSRKGRRSKSRLRTLKIAAGDLLLMQGPSEVLSEFASENGAVPLAERDLRLPDGRKALVASLIMGGAVAGAAFGILPAAISFALGVLASMVFRTVPPRKVYEAIDWPVVVLLGALIPVAGAMEATGMAELIARVLLENLAQGHAVVALTLILVVTMFLSDVMNNAATAAVMCPIAISAASVLGVNPDSFLMAVAIGASCAFLTPIGHQNNTLILGPGGFQFGDYWRLGLPLEILVVGAAVPTLLFVWPL